MVESGKASLLSLPSELLLELLRGHPSSLYSERREKGLTMEWYTWNAQKVSRYTVPWLEEHHPIALPLSQTCRPLRALMLPCIWEEVGISTLEELARVRDGLRLFPERGSLIIRLEWSWLLKHPAWDDVQYRSQHAIFERKRHLFKPLEMLLQPPFRWPKQPMTTKDECIEAITEVVCRAANLDTLLWCSPYLPMLPAVVDFLASKAVPLTRFQVDMGGSCFDVGTAQATILKPEPAAYWKFAEQLEHLSLDFHPVERVAWQEDDMARWQAYDDDLTGLEAFCKRTVEDRQRQAKQAGQSKLKPMAREAELFHCLYDEREAAMAYKILTVAFRGSLRSLALEPHWVLRTLALAPNWVKLEQFHLIRERRGQSNQEWLTRLKAEAHGGMDHLRPESKDFWWYSTDAAWHKAAAAIRPAVYHAARHRTDAGSLTAADVQALADRPPEYPLSLFYPCFRDASVAQGMAEMWDSLVERGESERIVCQCTECQGE